MLLGRSQRDLSLLFFLRGQNEFQPSLDQYRAFGRKTSYKELTDML